MVKVATTVALSRIAPVLVARKHLATLSAWVETRQATSQVVAAVAIGAVGARVKLNSTDPELADIRAVVVALVSPQATLPFRCTLKDSSRVQGR